MLRVQIIVFSSAKHQGVWRWLCVEEQEQTHMTNDLYGTVKLSLEYWLFRIITIEKDNSLSYIKMETKMIRGQNLFLWIFFYENVLILWSSYIKV